MAEDVFIDGHNGQRQVRCGHHIVSYGARSQISGIRCQVSGVSIYKISMFGYTEYDITSLTLRMDIMAVYLREDAEGIKPF